MGRKNTRAVKALVMSVVIALGATTGVAPAGATPPDAAGDPVTLMVGLDGAGAGAALAAAGVEVIDLIEPIGVVEVEIPAAAAAAALQALERAPGISFAELERDFQAELTPSDTYWDRQWGPRKVVAPTAWDTTTGATSVVIAVLDTGVQAGPEFTDKLLPGIDLVNDDDDATDDNGHGTSAAGVAAADANDEGIAGLCWSCQILPVKVLDDVGSGGTADIVSGITWAADQGADVINMSFGGTYSSLAVDEAVAYARSKGAVLIGAAGNEGITTPNYPAASPGVIGVAASDANDLRYTWSNHGSWVDVAAPGCNPAPALDGRYSDFCGTSSAAPLVSGIAGLAAALGVSATVIEDALTSTAVPVGSWVAHGRVDAAATVAAAAVAPPAEEPEPEPAPEPEPEPEPATLTVTRMAGDDRVLTGVALARHAFLDVAPADGAPAVVIARADAYADALAAAPLATKLGGPVLLTPGTGLHTAVADAITDLGATTAVLVGGENALSPTIEGQLAGLGVTDVRRIAGTNRFDTARLVGLQVGGSAAYVVEGANADLRRGWPDAVAVSTLASQQGRPILLTMADAVPAETTDALSQLGTTSVTIVGGTGAVSTAVADQLSELATVTRIAGTSRYHTSTLVADATVAAGADEGHIWIATGRSWPDALAAGPAAAAVGAVLLLVDGTDMAGSPESAAWLDARTALRDVILVGGTASVSDAVASEITALGTT